MLLVLWMAMIFLMSAEPGAESTETSNLVAGIIYGFYDFVWHGASHLSESEFMALYLQPIRKLAHFTEFMILGILLYINIREYRKDKAFLYSLICSALYALSDEIHQLFVVNRYCSLKDMCIDTAGALFGICLCHLVYSRWKKRH